MKIGRLLHKRFGWFECDYPIVDTVESGEVDETGGWWSKFTGHCPTCSKGSEWTSSQCERTYTTVGQRYLPAYLNRCLMPKHNIKSANEARLLQLKKKQ